jgi:hypothetical protein
VDIFRTRNKHNFFMALLILFISIFISMNAFCEYSLFYASFFEKFGGANCHCHVCLSVSLSYLLSFSSEIAVYHILGNNYEGFARRDICDITNTNICSRAKTTYQYQHACRKCISVTPQWKSISRQTSISSWEQDF